MRKQNSWDQDLLPLQNIHSDYDYDIFEPQHTFTDNDYETKRNLEGDGMNWLNETTNRQNSHNLLEENKYDVINSPPSPDYLKGIYGDADLSPRNKWESFSPQQNQEWESFSAPEIVPKRTHPKRKVIKKDINVELRKKRL